MSNYKSIHKEGRDEIIINKSRFIGTSCPVETEEEALEFIDRIKKEFKDATHNVYAYVIGENSNIQRFSDDGEPSGTAGMPVLNVIKQEDLRNTAVVVTRYFGGVMLGAGGLVRAYTKGSKIALESGVMVDKNLYYDVSFNLDYTLLGKMDNELLIKDIIVADRIYENQVLFKLLVDAEKLDEVRDLINEITSGQADITVGQATYLSIKDGKVVPSWK